LKLADTYSVTRLEAACEKALAYTATPSFRSIRTILKTGSEKWKPENITGNISNDKANAFAFTRGVTYYGGGNMVNEATISKLHEMKLSAMAEAYRQQMGDSALNGLSFSDRFGLLVDH